MSARQFADGALNHAVLVHPFFELLGLLIAPPLLQKLVMLTYYDGAMRLLGAGTHSERRGQLRQW
jgi:hypothetical protein